MINLENLQAWLGTQSSLDTILQTRNSLQKSLEAGVVKFAELRIQGTELLLAQPGADKGYEGHYMINSYGNGLATISVSGALISSHLPLRAYGYNVTTYEEIQRAAMTLYKDPEIDKIVMLYNTPGGGFSGLTKTGRMLNRIGAEKQLYSFSEGMMASAGYWLGATGRKVVVEKMAEIGSIGVYNMLISYADMLKKDGVEARVIRAGEFKALGHPYEPMSDKAIELAQERVDEIYSEFLDHASQARGAPKEAFRKKAAEGRVFSGAAAVKVGLADEIMIFDDFMAGLLQSGGKVKSKSSKLSANPKQANLWSFEMNIFELLAQAGISLSDEQKDALSSGAELSAIGLSEKDLKTAEEAIAAEEAKEKEKLKADDPAKDPAAPPAPAAQAPAAQADATITALTDKLLSLTSQVAEANTKLASVTAELSAAKKSAEENAVLVNLLKPIVIDRTKAMCTAMRKTAAGLEAMSVADLAKLFGDTKAEFEKAFPVGRKSEGSNTTPTPGRQLHHDPVYDKAALAAVQP